MTDLKTKPRSGRLLDTALYTELLGERLDVAQHAYESLEEFTAYSAIELANHSRAGVTLARVPYAPYYDTNYILKFFKTDNESQAHIEQVELEAASLHHAAEAFERNNKITRAPGVYTLNATANFIAMECIKGKGYRESDVDWWPKEKMIRFVRQMAVVRLAIMTQVANQLGVPRNSQHGGPVGPYCSFLWWDRYKSRVWGQIDRGPFANKHELILASLKRDLAVTRWMGLNRYELHHNSIFNGYQPTIAYLEVAIDNIDMVPRPTDPEWFSLSHNDLQDGFNIMLRGSKVAAVIDWETAAYDTLAMCVVDLTNATDYNPAVWREHAGPNGENVYILPYRLEVDPTPQLLDGSTKAGAEKKPFPDWELIENDGGPLGEDDFGGNFYPQDIGSGDDESILDAAEMHCDSDDDAGEACVMPQETGIEDENERIRTGEEPPDLAYDWYYEHVYALMKEFIRHHRGAGLGPDGAWGRLPEEYSRPLAEWDDPLYWRVTQRHFEGRHTDLISDVRVDVSTAKAAGAATPKHPNIRKQKTPRRHRRVPALLDSVYDTSVTGLRLPPESQMSRRWSAYVARNLPPRRIRTGQPRTHRKLHPCRKPTPTSDLHKVPAKANANHPAGVDHQRAEALPPDSGHVMRVRDSVMAKVMEKLKAR